jgi:hypothetical protein
MHAMRTIELDLVDVVRCLPLRDKDDMVGAAAMMNTIDNHRAMRRILLMNLKSVND